MERNKKSILLFILPVVWGTYYVASQKLVGYTSALTSGLLIRFCTMFALILVLLKRGELKALFQIKGAMGKLFVIGTLGFLLDITAFIGLSLSSAAAGTALLKCDVLMVNGLSMLIYKEKFSWRVWAFTFVMLAGAFMVMGIDFNHFRLADSGNVFFLLSAFFVSLNAFVIKSAQTNQSNPLSDGVIAFYNNFITLLYFGAASVMMGTFRQVMEIPGNPNTLKALGFAVIGQTFVYIIYYYNLRNHPVWLVKVCLLLMPVFSTIITFVLFDERMRGMQYLGIMVVIAGALGILIQQREKK